MFNMAEFVKTNLIKGFWEGSFNETQINIFATNYLLKGIITQKDFDEIQEAIKPKDEEIKNGIEEEPK